MNNLFDTRTSQQKIQDFYKYDPFPDYREMITNTLFYR